MGMGIERRQKIAARAAAEIKSGMVVNLGIGIPSLVPDYLPPDVHVMFHAENGIVGIGPSPPWGDEDENVCNAGGLPVTAVNGAVFCDSATAFAVIRRGLIDMTILGGLQVSEKGDLANWIVPGNKVPGMGGAMELAQKGKKVIILMSHLTNDKKAKIVRTCSLPLTAVNCVNLIITDMAVFQVNNSGLQLTEVFSPYTIEEVRIKTECDFNVSNSLKYK